LFCKIQNKAQLDRSAREILYDQAKVAYCDYYYHLYLHGRIDFYSNARNHCAKQQHKQRHNNSKFSKTYGGGPQVRN
jgi:hypothetical protein